MQENFAYEENAVWKQRFRAYSIQWAKISNLNRQRGLVCTDRNGIWQLYAWNVATGELQKLTDQPTGVVNGLISADGNYIYYLKDEGGNEIGHFVRVPFEGGPYEDITPDLPYYNSFHIHQSFLGNMLGIWVTDSSGQMLYVFAPDQEPWLIYKSQHLFYGPSLSFAGEIAVIATTKGTHSPDMRLIAFDLRTGKEMAGLWDGESVTHSLGKFAPSPNDFRMLTTTSKSGFTRPVIWNPRTGERQDLAINEIVGEVSAWGWSKDAKRVLLSQFHQAQQQLYLYDLETDSVTQLQHPDGVFGGGQENGFFTEDGDILVHWQDSAHPARMISLSGNTGQELETVLAAGDVPASQPLRSITYATDQGNAIQGWLAVPEGAGPFPTILHTHGGPMDVMTSTYSPEIQAWLDHGFAFCSINFHGSTTFGKEFQKSILGRLGELEVQDMAAGYKWLVENHIALPQAVFLSGYSYGGFLTLLALGKRPELWAGGMASVAIADWSLLYEDESETMRSFQRVMFGGSPLEKPIAHKNSSPITYADQIEAPVLVIQGCNDTRSPARQMLAFEARLKSFGKQIKIHWFDAGHRSQTQEQQIEHLEYKLQFTQNILGEKLMAGTKV